MVEAYWNIGCTIVEEEQRGRKRAEYGRYLLRGLSARLAREFGNSFSERNLRNFRQFYLCFPIWNSVRSELTWTHYRALMRVENSDAREWYMEEATDQNWSTRALQRQINSLYYDRLRMSNDKASVQREGQEKTTALAPSPRDFIKDPYVLEFLDIPDAHPFREADLEQAIIDKIQAFLLELGKGLAFVARQKRISTETKDFYIDLVFYNYILLRLCYEAGLACRGVVSALAFGLAQSCNTITRTGFTSTLWIRRPAGAAPSGLFLANSSLFTRKYT